MPPGTRVFIPCGSGVVAVLRVALKRWKGTAWRLRGTDYDGDYVQRGLAVTARCLSRTVGTMTRVRRAPRRTMTGET